MEITMIGSLTVLRYRQRYRHQSAVRRFIIVAGSDEVRAVLWIPGASDNIVSDAICSGLSSATFESSSHAGPLRTSGKLLCKTIPAAQFNTEYSNPFGPVGT